MENKYANPIYMTIGIFLLIASCIHVFRDSKKDPRIGDPWMHTLACLIIMWPLYYLFWLFWWPGKLRQKLFGSDEAHARKWARQQFNQK